MIIGFLFTFLCTLIAQIGRVTYFKHIYFSSLRSGLQGLTEHVPVFVRATLAFNQSELFVAFQSSRESTRLLPVVLIAGCLRAGLRALSHQW